MADLQSSPGHPLLVNRVAAVLAATFFVCLPFVVPNFRSARDSTSEPFAGDFLHEYTGAYIVLRGDYQRFYDPHYGYALQHDPEAMGTTFREGCFLPILYPPFYYVAVAPLALLPVQVAAIVWYVLMASCLAATLWLLVCAYPEHSALPAWGLAGAMFFVPTLLNFSMSQKGTLALLIVTATFLLLDRRRPFWAGLVFGLLAFKPQLTLVIAFAMVFKGQWRFVLGGAITGLALFGVSMLLSPDVSAQCFRLNASLADFAGRDGFPVGKMHCWYGFWNLLFAGEEMTLIQTITLFSSMATIGFLTRILWGAIDYGTPRFAVQFCVLVIATILLSPHLLTYDLTLLLLPFFLLTHLLLARPEVFCGHDKLVAWTLAFLYGMCCLTDYVVDYIHFHPTVPLLFALVAGLAVFCQGKCTRESTCQSSGELKKNACLI